MKEYKDVLLIEYLMFSTDIKKDIKDLENTIDQIDVTKLQDFVISLTAENMYTEKNLQNLKMIIIHLKNKFYNYDFLCNILEKVNPSYDIYYYEYLEKFDVLQESIHSFSQVVSRKFLEDSIRFDFYAFYAFLSEKNDYIEKHLKYLIQNPFTLLFIQKLINEKPEFLKNDTLFKRIKQILNFNIQTLDDERNTIYHQKLLKKVEYFKQNRKASFFDYEAFIFYKNISFLEYLLTHSVSYDDYKEYLTSEQFLYFLEDYTFDLITGTITFLYNQNMKKKFQEIISYILTQGVDNKTKIRCNHLLQNWSMCKVNDPDEFYYYEIRLKYFCLESVSYHNFDTLKKDIDLSVRYDYFILETYTLDDQNFEKMLPNINIEYYAKWMKKTMKLDDSFFLNEILRKRTIQIMNYFEKKQLENRMTLSENMDDIEKENFKKLKKMKKKILKIEKELE